MSDQYDLGERISDECDQKAQSHLYIVLLHKTEILRSVCSA